MTTSAPGTAHDTSAPGTAHEESAPDMARAFVAVGSNIKPAANVRAAVRALALRARIVAISTVYRTAPEGRPA